MFFLIGIIEVNAQNLEKSSPIQTDTTNLPVSLSFSFKTSHLWRGLDFSPSPYFSTDLSISDKNKIIKVGIWNGLGINESLFICCKVRIHI